MTQTTHIHTQQTLNETMTHFQLTKAKLYYQRATHKHSHPVYDSMFVQLKAYIHFIGRYSVWHNHIKRTTDRRIARQQQKFERHRAQRLNRMYQ